jgi:hypothetical protein
MTALACRFPPPWSVEELEACFVVTDTAGQKLANVYFEEGPERRSAAKRLGKMRRGGGVPAPLSGNFER